MVVHQVNVGTSLESNGLIIMVTPDPCWGHLSSLMRVRFNLSCLERKEELKTHADDHEIC